MTPCVLKSSKPYYHENSIVFANFPGYYKINKMCKSPFFHEKSERLKKIFFQKVLQNGKILSASIHFHGGNNWKRSFLSIKLTHLYQAENILR